MRAIAWIVTWSVLCIAPVACTAPAPATGTASGSATDAASGSVTDPASGTPSPSGTESHPAGSPTGDRARCESLLATWRQQVDVTVDARRRAEALGDPASRQRAAEVARRDQEIADSMKATLVRLGCAPA